MSDTMAIMDELTIVDRISAWQLENDDLIKMNDEIVKVTNVIGVDEGILVVYENDFAEEDSATIPDDTILDLYMYL